MTERTCPLENDVVAAVLAGSMDDSLRTHVASCAICGEVAGLVALVHDDYSRAIEAAQLPTADLVWLRAQIRAREEAARAAARPILLTQAVAIAALIGLLVSLAGRFSLGFWSMPLRDGVFSPTLLGVAAVLLCGLVLAPVAVYVAFSRD